MSCLEPGCFQWTLTTSPFCYWHTKVLDGLVDGYVDLAVVDGVERRVWVKVHKLVAA